MIIFEPGGGKNLVLIILVVLFSGIIIWQWAARNPFASVQSNSHLLVDVKENTSDSFDKVRESVAAGQAQFLNIGEELNKQIQQEKLLEETKKYLENKEEEDKTLVVPDNQVDCEAQGGEWDNFGPDLVEECNLPTTDFGTVCTSAKQCQGYCFTDDPEIYEIATKDNPIEATGKCSKDTMSRGRCLAIIRDGKTEGVFCRE